MKKARQEMNIFDRRKHDQNTIRKLLKECKDPKKGLHSKEIMGVLNISSSVFKTRIDPMIEDGEVEFYPNPDNRREHLYRIRDLQKTKAEVKRYYTTQFLENMKDPTFYEDSKRISPYKISIAIFGEGTYRNRQEKIRDQKQLAKMVDTTLATPAVVPLVKSMKLGVNKLALVFMFEKV